jgi:type I restriction enzyme, S subunit
MNQEEIQIPKGWELKRLDSVCVVERGKFGHRPRNDPDYYGGKYPFIQTGDITKSKGKINSYTQTLNEKGFKVSRLFPRKTVVITISANIGDTAILEIDSCFPDSIIGITPIEGETISEYIEYVLRIYKKKFNRDAKKGAQKNINYDFLKPLQIPIPPTIDIQKKIVKKLDKILGQIEKKKIEILKLNQQTNYDKIITSSKNYFLKLAFSGVLTEDWRKNNTQIKPAHILIQKIIEERKKLFTLQLEHAECNGLRKPKSKFLLELPELIPKKTELPNSWTVTSVNFLAHVTKLAGFEYTKYFHPTPDGEVPLIRAQNVQMGKFNNSNIKFIPRKISDILERSQVNGGEILMAFIGDVGNVCLAPTDQRWHLAPNVAKIIVDGIEREYLYYYLQSPVGIQDTVSRIRKSAQPSLSMGTIRMINVNLPPLEEQKEIIRLLKTKLNHIESYREQTIELTKKRESLVKYFNHVQLSVIKSAFSGKLVN